MIIIDGTNADIIRNKYIDIFIDKTSEIYKNYISIKKLYVDGSCYLGYLWDCYKNFSITSESYCLELFKTQNTFFVFWDIHSCENILIPQYWKYSKTSILNLNYDEFLLIYDKLPEDIYLVAEDYSFTIALTHEFINNKRYCYLSYNSL